jgi:phenylalanyl-tRNA synthetase alpha chain
VTEKMNFYDLNFSKNHPAINQHDTFYVRKNKILRTHCTVITYEKLTELLKKNELRSGVFTVGEVYRRDTDDKTHNHQFSQLDVVVVGKEISLQDLFRTVNHFLVEILEINPQKIF